MFQYKHVEFLAGVIDGSYAKPWTHAERFALVGRMAAWGLNTRLCAPKDDFITPQAVNEPGYSRPKSPSVS